MARIPVNFAMRTAEIGSGSAQVSPDFNQGAIAARGRAQQEIAAGVQDMTGGVMQAADAVFQRQREFEAKAEVLGLNAAMMEADRLHVNTLADTTDEKAIARATQDQIKALQGHAKTLKTRQAREAAQELLVTFQGRLQGRQDGRLREIRSKDLVAKVELMQGEAVKSSWTPDPALQGRKRAEAETIGRASAQMLQDAGLLTEAEAAQFVEEHLKTVDAFRAKSALQALAASDAGPDELDAQVRAYRADLNKPELYPALTGAERDNYREQAGQIGKAMKKQLAERAKAQRETVADQTRAAVKEAKRLGDYNLGQLYEQISQAEKAGAFDAEEAADWRNFVDNGYADQTSDGVQAQLNTLELGIADQSIKPDQADRALRKLMTEATAKDAGRLFSLLDTVRKGGEAGPTSYRAATDYIKELSGLGIFGNRVIDDGKDITDQTRREELERLLDDDASRLPFYGGSKEALAKRKADIRAEFLKKREEEDRLYNGVTKMARAWAEQNPAATPEQVREYINGLLARPLESEAFKTSLGRMK